MSRAMDSGTFPATSAGTATHASCRWRSTTQARGLVGEAQRRTMSSVTATLFSDLAHTHERLADGDEHFS